MTVKSYHCSSSTFRKSYSDGIWIPLLDESEITQWPRNDPVTQKQPDNNPKWIGMNWYFHPILDFFLFRIFWDNNWTASFSSNGIVCHMTIHLWLWCKSKIFSNFSANRFWEIFGNFIEKFIACYIWICDKFTSEKAPTPISTKIS